MNKRIFILTLVFLGVVLTGWIYYVSAQAKAAASIEKISVDWWGSGHADKTSLAFTYWNTAEPAEIPAYCAKCHSGPAFLDFLGQDGSTEFKVDAPGPIERVITCEVCHNEKAHALEEVSFPSGEILKMADRSALCGTCHSGLSAGNQVTDAIRGKADDEVLPDAAFITPHYYYAATTAYGTQAKGGYEYPHKTYAGKFYHAEGVQNCTQCHDPHNLLIQKEYKGRNVDLCGACHPIVTGYADYKSIFVDGVDYDADGKVEGVYHEIEGVQEVLYEAIQHYAKEILGSPIIWADQNPYLFIDSNANGKADKEEINPMNVYSKFTPRLLRAGFNYQFSLKDPGGYVHNGKYMLQLLFDSIEDLASVVKVPINGLIRPVG